MKSVKLFTLIGVLTLSSFAHAAQENSGMSLCRDADIECSATSPNDQTNVCIFTQSKTADVTSPSGALTVLRNIRLVPSKAGVDGAGINYEGQGFSLHVNTDSYQDANHGTPAILTVLKMHIQNHRLSCSKN